VSNDTGIQRPPRISDAEIAEICKMDLLGKSEREIASWMRMSRRTVARTLARIRATQALTASLAEERSRAVATYRSIMAAAWAAAEAAKTRGHSPAPQFSVIVSAQSRIDRVLGLESAPAVNDEVAEFKKAVIDMIRSEAPQVASSLSRKFLAVSDA
jgi:hypothetical protein